jgi:hypothetical protein
MSAYAGSEAVCGMQFEGSIVDSAYFFATAVCVILAAMPVLVKLAGAV